MTDWKSPERILAKRLGGKRNPITGRGDKPDLENVVVTVEEKTRASFPKWLTKALSQAQAGRDERRLPIVLLHEKYERYDNTLVLIRLKDFEDFFLDTHPVEPDV